MAEKYSYFFLTEEPIGAEPGKDATWMHTFPIFNKKLDHSKACCAGWIQVFREFEHCKVELDIEQERGGLIWAEDSPD